MEGVPEWQCDILNSFTEDRRSKYAFALRTVGKPIFSLDFHLAYGTLSE
jgi:hypothetical protein